MAFCVVLVLVVERNFDGCGSSRNAQLRVKEKDAALCESQIKTRTNATNQAPSARPAQQSEYLFQVVVCVCVLLFVVLFLILGFPSDLGIHGTPLDVQCGAQGFGSDLFWYVLKIAPQSVSLIRYAVFCLTKLRLTCGHVSR
jgi:hypothetical protein